MFFFSVSRGVVDAMMHHSHFALQFFFNYKWGPDGCAHLLFFFSLPKTLFSLGMII